MAVEEALYIRNGNHKGNNDCSDSIGLDSPTSISFVVVVILSQLWRYRRLRHASGSAYMPHKVNALQNIQVSYLECGSWYLPPFGFSESTVIVWRHFGDQEWKLLGHVHPHKKLLGEIGVPIGIGKNNVNDVACAAQW